MIFTLGTIFLVCGISYLENNLPPVDMLKDVQLQVPLKIYSADGQLIAEYGEKRRTPLTLEKIPQDMINAILATEDCRFYKHPGVDFRAILRAMHAILTSGSKVQGGSTITMQTARSFFLSRKKTYLRKINEILLALKIEQELTKNEILALYLNKIYLGKRAYGVAAAAEVYYGTTIDQLTLAQHAMIAGLPQAPSAINPLNAPKLALKRRTHVLNRMLSYNFISQQQYQDAIDAPLTARYHQRNIELKAPYIAEMVRQQLVEQFGDEIYDKGYEVITTVNSKLQDAANKSLIRSLLEYDQRHGYRGPITHFELTENSNAPEELALWLQKLQDIPKINNLTPAVITAIDAKHAWARMQDGKYIEIKWKGLSWAKKQLANGKLGKKPKTTSDVLQVGDVIYAMEQKNNKWQLAQLPQVEGALVAIHPNNGKILSLVGGFDYEQSRFNRAIQAERQPGSSFKPFIYGAALENGFTTASIINDAPIVQEDPIAEYDWRPQNYTKKFYGPTRLRIGITHSRNLVSIRILKSLGIDKAIDFITKCGLHERSLPKSLSLALGTNHLSPLELATAYSIFPNGGYRIEPYFIEKIIDYQDNIIFQANPLTVCENCENNNPAPQVIKPQTAYLITSLLQDAILSGTGKKILKLGRRDLAGKTGTTNDWNDGWYSGYNRDLVVTTWVGFDEPRSLKEYAVKAALPMWMYFMEQSLQNQPENSPNQPPGLTTVRIDPETGLLARSGQADGIYEIFVEGTAPTETAPLSTVPGLFADDDEDSINVENLF